MAQSTARSSPYVVELQRQCRVRQDEISRKGNKGYTSNPSLSPHVHGHSKKSHVSHVLLDPSRLNRTSLEYEDIYTQRNYSRATSRLGQYGRYSYRDDGGYSRYGRVPQMRYTRGSSGIKRGTEMVMNGDVRHVGGTTIIDRTDKNGTKGDKSRPTRSTEASYKAGHMGTSHEQNRTAKDSKRAKREELEMWIARQTSFPRKVNQDVVVDISNPRVLGNNQNPVSHDSVSIQSNSIYNKARRPPPPVAPKPARPIPQTSRTPSPASSVRSNQSVASSHVSQHSARSAASEVSVKSILKKPKPGRLVLKKEPSSYMLCAVLSCIFCFPVGIYALAKSLQVKEAVDENDYEAALSSSRKVKHFFIGVLLSYVGLIAVAGALLAVYFTTGKIF